MALGACARQPGMITVEDLTDRDAAQQDSGDDYAEEVPGDNEPPLEFPGAATSPDFIFNATKVRLAHDLAQFWEGCNSQQVVRGGYESDTSCSKAYIQPSFAVHLNQHFFSCVKRAASKAGYAEPTKAFIRHWGTYNDRSARGSTRLSMHAYARAIDVVNFNLYDRSGNLTRVPTHVRNYSGKVAVFYDDFRDCWKSTIPSTCRSSDTESVGSIGHPSSKLGGNTLHNDHLHLSYPLCAR